jgi:protein O-mannosyl-transferase
VRRQGLLANLSDSRKASLWALAVCLLLVAVCYANSINNAFILDDVAIVATNEQIRSIQPLHFLSQSYWGEQINGWVYRPLTIFSFSVEYSIWKAWPAGFRLTNLLLHALNGWLVFLLVRSILGSLPAAWASAVVYIVHPAHTEAVVNIVGRSELLAASLFFAGWLAFRKGHTWLAAAAYMLSLLSKENAIVLPAVIALEMLLDGGGLRKVLLSWRRFAVLGSVALAYLALRIYILGRLGPPAIGQYMHGALTLVERWMTSGRVFLQYLRLMFWPVEVTGDYEFNSIPVAHPGDWDAWVGLILVAACLLAAMWLARRRSKVSLGILFVFVTLLPVSNWIMPIAVLMAERFLYTPMFGFALLAGAFWAGIRDGRIRRLTAAGVVAVAVLLCVSHNYIWQDKLTFHRNLLRVFPENARGRLGYGFALLQGNKVEEAKEQFEEGLRILPNSAPLKAALASAIMRMDRQCGRARPLLDEALREDPTLWHGLWVLGDCFTLEGQINRAEEAFAEAVRITDFPDVKLLYSWGRSLEGLGQFEKAIRVYERAARIDPTDLDVQLRLKLLRPVHG